MLAEELGFDSVFMTEHHFSRHGIVPDSLAMLPYLAAQTERIRLRTAVSVSPLHDPVRLAESAALFDVLSDGRFEFGIGRGYQWGEFDRFARSLDDRAARFDECILDVPLGHVRPRVAGGHLVVPDGETPDVLECRRAVTDHLMQRIPIASLSSPSACQSTGISIITVLAGGGDRLINYQSLRHLFLSLRQLFADRLQSNVEGFGLALPQHRKPALDDDPAAVRITNRDV